MTDAFNSGGPPLADRRLVAVTVFLALCWPALLVAIVAAFVWYVIRPTVTAAWRHKLVTIVILISALSIMCLGLVETAGLATGLTLTAAVELVAWRLGWPDTFTRYVAGPWTRRRRRLRLTKRWPDIVTGHGLAHLHTTRTWRGPRQVTAVPALRSVSCGPWRDELVVRPLPGQDVDTWTKRAPALGLHLGALRCRVAVHDAAHLRVELLRADPLAATIAPFPRRRADDIDLSAIPVGLLENGDVFTVSVTGGRHLFIAGETEAGKSSYVWSIIAGLAPLVRLGVVRLWGIDPKCQEFTFGAAMFHRLATMARPDEMADVLDEAAEVMHHKAVATAGVARTHRPTTDNPLDVVIVDEAGFLTAYFGDSNFRKRIVRALSAIATQGRTTGFHLIACAQDPGKEVLPLRNLFPARIALRLREASNVDMVLGSGARAAGAHCDQIPAGLRGVGYVLIDGAAEPQRVRSAYLDDPTITHLARHYPAGRALDVTTADDDLGHAA